MEEKTKMARVVLIDKQQQIALHRRPDSSKIARNKLQLVGGKFSDNSENRKRAAQREVREELGIEIPLAAFLFLGTDKNDRWPGHYFLALYQDTLKTFPHEVKDDGGTIEVYSVTEIPFDELAFEDHQLFINTAMRLLYD